MARPAAAAVAPRLDVIREFTPGFTRRSAPVLLSTGGIVMTGLIAPGAIFAIGRFISDGRPDTTFGTGGLVLPPSVPQAGPSDHDRVLVQPDGRIVVATSLPPQADKVFRIAMVRLHPNGALDLSFNGDGAAFVSFPEPGSIPAVGGVLLRPDGRILVVVSGGSSTLSLAQLLPNGDLDRGFGSEGKLHAPVPARTSLRDAALDAAGNAVVVGASVREDSAQDMLVARFRADGSPDSGFGFHGTTLLDFGRGSDIGGRLLLQPDGTTVVAGEAGTGSRTSVLALARIGADGVVDPSFGSSGLVRLDLARTPGSVRIGGLVQLSDGRLAAAGSYLVRSPGPRQDPLARRELFVTVVRADGAPDPSFNAGTPVFQGDLAATNVKLAVEPKDRLLVLGSAAAVHVSAAVPKASPLRLTIGATPNPAGPGPVRFVVTITNQSDAAAGGVLRLHASKKVAVEASMLVKADVSPIGVDVVGKVAAVPAGGAATLTLRTSATGFEEGIVLSGSIATTDAGGNPVSSASSTTVLTSRGVVI